MGEPSHFSEVQRRITDGLHSVRTRIENAALSAGRNPDDIRLVVVTKGRTLEEVKAVLDEGVADIGENRVSEAYAKWHALQESMADNGELNKVPSWAVEGCLTRVSLHLVGHLQRNKVSKAVQFVDYLHSLDSLELVQAITKRSVRSESDDKEAQKTRKSRRDKVSPFLAVTEPAKDIGRYVPQDIAMDDSSRFFSRNRVTEQEQGDRYQRANVQVLVQVNVTEEPQKHGVPVGQVLPFVEQVLNRGLCPIGLMCMSRQGASPIEHARNFERLARLRDELVERVDPRITELSMGMSDDFEVAIAAGATMVRIGRAIFDPENS